MTSPDPSVRQPDIAAEGPPTISVDAAFARYEDIRVRLPQARPARAVPRRAAGLLELADEFDGLLFDSFWSAPLGVDNRICILTNAANFTGEAALAKYRRLKLEVKRDEIVSSRDVTFAHLGTVAADQRWGAIYAEDHRFGDTRDHALFDLLQPRTEWDEAESIPFLSSARWTAALLGRLVGARSMRPRPVVIGNPDLVAAREVGLTVEPGFWAHDLQDRTGFAPHLFGKPNPEAFSIALTGLAPGRYAMIGDTLHTDILGGQAAGLATILATDHGIFAGKATVLYVARSGISPDYILPSI